MHPQYFDSSAKTYDGDFTNTAIGKLQRAQVWNYLLPLLTSPRNILEINCGTGEDAWALSSQGHRVLATDVSGEMIEVAKAKLNNNQLSLRIVQAGFSSVKQCVGEEKFDLLFSNFGGLNCIDQTDLKNLSNDFASILKPNGKMFMVIMGTNCRWEQGYFLMKRNREKAFRRKNKNGVITTIRESVFKTYYYSPEEITSMFASHFDMERIHPVGLFTPPSYLEFFFKNKKWLLSILNQLDNWIGSLSVFPNQSDHFVIVLKKKIL